MRRFSFWNRDYIGDILTAYFDQMAHASLSLSVLFLYRSTALRTLHQEAY